ncbi:MAG: hybrid sensor histidine kinase/response regulator [Armatimonadota bacterium]
MDRNIDQSLPKETELIAASKLESLHVLAGGVAHDFNNILTSIMGNIALAKLGMDQHAREFQHLETAEAACERARGLVAQLLGLTKGNMVLTNHSSLDKVLRETIQFATTGMNVKCRFEISNDLHMVGVDDGMLSQIIQNLIINAEQAMPHGGIITCSANNIELGSSSPVPLKPGNYVRLLVQDNGAGIPPHIMPRIFEPFYTTKSSGSGLGLATVKALIERFGGWIGVESAVNAGTTFTILVPAVENQVCIERKQPSNLVGGSGRILIMDDDTSISEVLSTVLRQMGYHTETAGHGVEAISKYRLALQEGAPFDLVLLDALVPGGMGGLDCLSELYQLDNSVNALICSGSYQGFEDDLPGCRGHVMKPFRLHDITGRIAELLKSTRTLQTNE